MRGGSNLALVMLTCVISWPIMWWASWAMLKPSTFIGNVGVFLVGFLGTMGAVFVVIVGIVTADTIRAKSNGEENHDRRGCP